MFKSNSLFLSLGFTSIILGFSVLSAEDAEAAITWAGTGESGGDGVPTGSSYEMFGMAYGYDNDRFYMAIDSNLELGGVNTATNPAGNNNISYGDVFLNFTSDSSPNRRFSRGKLFAVRFASNNDSKNIGGLGLYKNVTAKSVSTDNVGFNNLEQYSNSVGSVASLGDIDDYGKSNGTWNYFNDTGSGTTPILNVIDSGTKVGDIAELTTSEIDSLKNSGFTQQGSELYGFSFALSALGLTDTDPKDFVAHLFAECGNDGMGIEGHLPFISTGPGSEIPEPSALGGLLAIGLTAMSFKKLKRA